MPQQFYWRGARVVGDSNTDTDRNVKGYAIYNDWLFKLFYQLFGYRIYVLFAFDI